MRDFSKKELEEAQTHGKDIEEDLTWCLETLYRTKKYGVLEEVVHGLTFEELIGILIEARESVKMLKQSEAEFELVEVELRAKEGGNPQGQRMTGRYHGSDTED